MKGFKFELEGQIYTITEFHKSTGRFVGINQEGQEVDMHKSNDNYTLFNPKAVAKKIVNVSARAVKAGNDAYEITIERLRKGTQHDYEYNGKKCKYDVRYSRWMVRLGELADLCTLFGEEALFDTHLDIDSCTCCEELVTF